LISQLSFLIILNLSFKSKTFSAEVYFMKKS
jgi:hypothetical protein